jgi:uncharacterized membrane protein YsdA (DUF1294 family)
MNAQQTILTALFLGMTLVGLLSMGFDKMRAKTKGWRVPEATLFLIALLFGGVGSTLGMFLFRHKTKHWYFRIGLPLLAIVSLGAFLFLFNTFATV